MSLHRKKLTIALAATAAMAVTAGCGDDGGKKGDAAGGEPEHITVSVAHPENINGLMWSVGIDEGFFEDEGVIVDEVIPAEGGGDTLQNVVSGQLPFGQVATGALVNGFKEGAPIQVISGATQSVYEIGWCVLKDSPVQTVDDLAGKTWGFTTPGSVTEAMSYLVPAAAGIGADGIERASTGGVGAGIALLEAGDVDVTFCPPEVQLSESDTLRLVTSSDKYVPAYPTTMLVTARNYAKDHPELTKGMLRGAQKAIDWIKDNPQDAADKLAKAAELDPENARTLVDNYIDVDLWGLPFNADALKSAAEGLKYTDDIDSVDWKGLLNDEFLPEGEKGKIPG